MYAWTQPVIIVALICLVPWTVVYGLAVASDSFYTWSSHRNPRQMQVLLREFEPVPDHLEASHEALLLLNFEPIAVDETGDGKEWLYRHADISMLLAVLNEDAAHQSVVEFVSRFRGLFVITTCGSSEDSPVQTPGLILNNIDEGITPALTYHLAVAEAELARSGALQPLNTPEDYQTWMTEFRAVIRHNSLANRWQQISAVLLLVSSVGGLAGLVLMQTAQLAEGVAIGLALLLWAMIALQVRWILRPPWENSPVSKQITQTDTV